MPWFQKPRMHHRALCLVAWAAATLLVGVARANPNPDPTGLSEPTQATSRPDASRSDPSPQALWLAGSARALVNWVHLTQDNEGLPFVVIDKTAAVAHVFDRQGGVLGTAPVLIGQTMGDDSAPGVGSKRIADIPPSERTTPAGRFLSAMGRNLAGVEILWVDYDAAVSMHPVVTTHPKERREQRLASPSPADNRISYGCINVSKAFFLQVVAPAFRGAGGVVYVLPESRSMSATFGPPWLAGQAIGALHAD